MKMCGWFTAYSTGSNVLVGGTGRLIGGVRSLAAEGRRSIEREKQKYGSLANKPTKVRPWVFLLLRVKYISSDDDSTS